MTGPTGMASATGPGRVLSEARGDLEMGGDVLAGCQGDLAGWPCAREVANGTCVPAGVARGLQVLPLSWTCVGLAEGSRAHVRVHRVLRTQVTLCAQEPDQLPCTSAAAAAAAAAVFRSLPPVLRVAAASWVTLGDSWRAWDLLTSPTSQLLRQLGGAAPNFPLCSPGGHMQGFLQRSILSPFSVVLFRLGHAWCPGWASSPHGPASASRVLGSQAYTVPRRLAQASLYKAGDLA